MIKLPKEVKCLMPNRQRPIINVFLCLAITISAPVCMGRTINLGTIDLGYVPDYSWYGQYNSRETVSDRSDLPTCSQSNVDAWKKKFLSIPYPPRYTKSRQTRDDQEVWGRVDSHYRHLLSFSNRLETAYIEYMRYGLDVKKINDVCSKIRAATQVRAWKDCWERTTRVRNKANEELRKVISAVDGEVDKLFEPLVAIKKKEYELWANKHPQQAMSIAVKRRVKEAEMRAANAELAARRAEARAADAEARAAAAEWRAEDAEQNAGAAINAARGAINAVREARGY